ncbi:MULTISPECIES: FadR/GntR family transcriptional regulator [unclassified Streptomyces]|uniref:FadR/GntR family transcriptional regulator n=1 Tax=unclassified Streptomyces TaxID=2593676 RepID=UPI00099B7E20|nr:MULTISPECIES: FCD domain-containing protein [unclassified Streptomyces]QHF95219.1 FadR family transcriptional regulator [Streptomyces sp. NHF165]
MEQAEEPAPVTRSGTPGSGAFPSVGPEGRAPGGLGPLQVPSAVDHVADRLLTAIALGEFSVGERLPTERELAEILAVGRPTVRAAIARLRDIGCLEVVRGRSGGHYVRSGWQRESGPAVRRTLLPHWERTKNLLDARCLLESLIARTAAERRDDEDSARITRALEEYTEAADSGDGARIRTSDAMLHRAVARAAKNEPLAVYGHQLLQEISAGFPIEPYGGNLTERALTEHRALVRAVLEGDQEEAGRVAAHHFTITEQTLSAVLERSTDA